MGAMSRLLGRPAQDFSTVADYEAVTGPVYAWRHAVAQDARTGRRAQRGGDRGCLARPSGRRSSRPRPSRGRHLGSARRRGAGSRPGTSAAGRLRRRALVAAFPLAVAALNRAGLGPLRASISGHELRSAGLRAMGEVAARLGLGDAYVVFGHTHRAGPLPGDEQLEWRGGLAAESPGSGARLINAGCWTYDPVFLTPTPGESPYWPGTCVLVEDSGPPVLKRLLLDRTHDELRPVPQAAPA